MKEERELTVGQYLRQEREKKNISLDSIAQSTRISLKNLEALEKDEFHTFPASVFIRGFLRTYANQIGIDPNEIIAIYEAQTDSLSASKKTKVPPPSPNNRPRFKYIITLSIVVLVAVLAFSFFFSKSPAPPPPPSPSPANSSPSKPETKAPVPEPLPPQEKEVQKIPEPGMADKPPDKITSTQTAIAPAGVEKEEKKERRHVLRIMASEKTWLRIRADDQPEFEVLLQPKEKGTWTARRQFKITVGNAGGVELSFNGIPHGRLGETGQVVHLLWPKEIKKREPGEKGKDEERNRP